MFQSIFFFKINVTSCLYPFLLNLTEEKKTLECIRLCGSGWWAEEGDPNCCPKKKGYGTSLRCKALLWALRRSRVETPTPSLQFEGSENVSLSLALNQGKPNVTSDIYLPHKHRIKKNIVHFQSHICTKRAQIQTKHNSQ